MHRSSKRPRWSNRLQYSLSELTSGDYFENPTIRAKTRVFRNLCLGNKINTSNAFDIDMIGYFKAWLDTEKLSLNNSNDDVKMFQEISEFLEASAKIYGFRVDNIRETTGKLIYGIKVLQERKGEDNEPVQINPKSKRLRLMLTTTDKLNRRSVELGHFTNQDIKYLFSNFKLTFAFKTGCPRDYMSKLFNNVIENEYKLKNTKEHYDGKNSTLQIFVITDEIICKEALKCSEISDLNSELKKCSKFKKRNEMELDGIEDEFISSLYPSPTYSNSNEVDYQEDNFDAYSNNEDKPGIDGLVECIDDVERNYSFFNPKLLSRWKGPRAWKAQAMAKALKSNKSKEIKQLMDDLNLDNNSDIDDDILPSKDKKSKQKRKNGKDVDKTVKVNWLPKKEIQALYDCQPKSKHMLNPSVLQKWKNNNCNILPRKSIYNLEYRFKFLEYLTIIPPCCTEDKDDDNLNASLPMPEPMDIDDPDQASPQSFDVVNDDSNDGLNEYDLNSPNLKLDKSFDYDNEFATESNTDITILKKEISDIIDAECNKIGSDSKWSSGLLFSDLLVKLENVHKGQELTVGMAYVGLLHLANDRGLKMFQDGSIINDQPLPMVWDDMGKGYLEVIPSSPLAVNIDDMRVITAPSLKFHDFDALPVKMKLYNNGRTVTLNGNWSSDKRPSISGSSLVETYCFSHLHFHWTDNDDFGSEHTIDGKGHAMEMHLIFFKRSCKTIFEAESQQNGYVTLAYVFDITPNGQHLGIDSITLHLNKIQECRKTVQIPVVPLSQLVGNRAGEYFTYLGTTNKLGGKVSVTPWIIFTEARGITSEQLKQLRCTMDARGHLIGRNCRAANVAPAGNAAPYLVQQPTASSSPEGAADERTRNETGPEVIAADAFPGGSARLGPIKGHLGSNLPPTVSTTSVRSVRLLKTNKTHVLRCELVKKRITHSRSAVANGSATARPKINAESTVDVTANSQEWTVVKPPWK